MKTRIRIQDVAEFAGVSTATVDRVLHAREGVSTRAADRVKRAVIELGYGALPSHIQSESRRTCRFALLLPTDRTSFVRSLEAEAREAINATSGPRISLSINRINLTEGSDTIRALDQLHPDVTDAAAVFAVDLPGVKSAIDRAVERGIQICTIVSDIPSSRRFAFVGQDGMTAGRTAGRLVGFFTRHSGKVAIVTGSSYIRDQIERNMGFSQIVTARYPDLSILPPFEGASNAETNRKYVTSLLAREKEIVAIYCSGGGVSGIIDALRQSGRERKIALIVHELTPATRDGLISGTVDAIVNQNRHQMMKNALDAMMCAIEKKPWVQKMIEPEIFLAENLP